MQVDYEVPHRHGGEIGKSADGCCRFDFGGNGNESFGEA